MMRHGFTGKSLVIKEASFCKSVIFENLGSSVPGRAGYKAAQHEPPRPGCQRNADELEYEMIIMLCQWLGLRLARALALILHQSPSYGCQVAKSWTRKSACLYIYKRI